MEEYTQQEKILKPSSAGTPTLFLAPAVWMLGAINSLQAQTLTWLGTLGGDRSTANAVSANGSIVGLCAQRGE